MVRKSKLAQMLLGCLATVATVSCGTDDGIDVKDIDATLGINVNNLQLPGNNSTHEIVFDELFDIDTTECIKIDKKSGEYVFRKKGGDVEPTNVSVNPITITTDQNNIHPTPLVLSFSDLGVDVSARRRDGSIETGIKEIWETIQNFEFNETNLVGDVVDINTAESQSHIQLIANFSNDLAQVLPVFSGLTFYLPEYITLSNLTCNNGSITLLDGHTIQVSDVYTTRGRLVINANISQLDLQVLNKPTLPAYLYYERTKRYDDTYRGAVHLKGNVRLKATFSPDMVKVNNLRTDMRFAIDNTLNINNINIVSGSGRFCPSINLDDIGSISIGNDVPSFLNDPDVKLMLDNPVLKLDIESDLTIDGFIDGTIESQYRADAALAPRALPINGIKAKRGQVSHIVVCNYNPNTSVYNEANGYQVIETGRTGQNLSWLLEKIPGKIEFSCVARADESTPGTINLGQQYYVKPSYEFEAKLALNSGSSIVYNDSVTDWRKDLKDLDLSVGSTITAVTDATNKSPLDLQVSITPVGVVKANGVRDRLDNIIGVEVTTDKPGNKVTSNGTTKLTIKVTQKQKGAFKQLDGLRFKAIGTSQQNGQPINSGLGTDKTKHTLKLENITITLNGQVEYDAN